MPATERSKPFEITTRLSPAAAMASGAALLERLVTPETVRALRIPERVEREEDDVENGDDARAVGQAAPDRDA